MSWEGDRHVKHEASGLVGAASFGVLDGKDKPTGLDVTKKEFHYGPERACSARTR